MLDKEATRSNCMHAVLKLNMLVVLRVFMVSSSLINYKAPEFDRCITKWDLLTI